MEHLVTPKYYVERANPLGTDHSNNYNCVQRTVCYILLNIPPSPYFNAIYTIYGAEHTRRWSCCQMGNSLEATGRLLDYFMLIPGNQIDQ